MFPTSQLPPGDDRESLTLIVHGTDRQFFCDLPQPLRPLPKLNPNGPPS